MSDQVVIVVPKSFFHRFFGKVVLVVILGGLFGYFLGQSVQKEFNQWKQMTPAEKKAYLDQRNQDYEKNLKDQLPTWTFMAAMVVIFGLYELLGLGLSGIFKKIFPFPKSSSP